MKGIPNSNKTGGDKMKKNPRIVENQEVKK